MALRRVVVTGLGCVSPLGIGAHHVWTRLLAGDVGIKSIQDMGDDLPSKVAGVVPAGYKEGGGFDALEWMSADDVRRSALFTQYARCAAEQALQDAGWRPTTQHERHHTGVCIGSGIGSLQDFVSNISAWQDRGARRVSPLFVPRLLVNMAAGHVSIAYGCQALVHAASTACTTGLHAVGDASRFIQYGDADVILAGGTEACVHPLAMAGFSKAKSLSTTFNHTPEKASRPFDKDRDGFVIGEGATVLVLEELGHAQKRHARIYAEVSGYGLSGDAHHLTAPPQDGAGAQLCMKRALKHSGKSIYEVDYINAHATSTPQGDAAEIQAILAVFSDKAARDNLAISSTKGATGHLLGAAGAIEAMFSVLAIHHGVVPPTVNLDETDVLDGYPSLNLVANQPQHRPVRTALTNSFGFGGTNASIVFSAL